MVKVSILDIGFEISTCSIDTVWNKTTIVSNAIISRIFNGDVIPIKTTRYPSIPKMIFDSSSVPSGIYLMKLITEKEVVVKKFLIMH